MNYADGMEKIVHPGNRVPVISTESPVSVVMTRDLAQDHVNMEQDFSQVRNDGYKNLD